MSRTIRTKSIGVHNAASIQNAVTALQNAGVKITLPHGIEARGVSLYSGVRQGIELQLDNWRYPVSIGQNGQVSYDNYDGSWGNISELDRFLQEYAKQEAIAQYTELGFTVDEFNTQVNEQGELQLVMVQADEMI